MNVIIFSKDRAAQLDLLLRSMPDEMAHKAWVIIRCSDTGYYNGYLRVIEDHWATFAFQSDFKQDVLNAISTKDGLTVFFTDDDIFINQLPAIPTMPDDMACVSLRLNPRMGVCYTMNRRQYPPRDIKEHDGGYVWDWRNADADYGYPMSLDGHIFRTADILPLLKRLDYHDPNSLEGQLARYPINRPMMMCFDKSVIVNNPANRVQETAKNRHGNISAEWLNNQFLAGKRIKHAPFWGYEPNACHVELPIEWE